MKGKTALPTPIFVASSDTVSISMPKGFDKAINKTKFKNPKTANPTACLTQVITNNQPLFFSASS